MTATTTVLFPALARVAPTSGPRMVFCTLAHRDGMREYMAEMGYPVQDWAEVYAGPTPHDEHGQPMGIAVCRWCREVLA